MQNDCRKKTLVSMIKSKTPKDRKKDPEINYQVEKMTSVSGIFRVYKIKALARNWLIITLNNCSTLI